MQGRGKKKRENRLSQEQDCLIKYSAYTVSVVICYKSMVLEL